MAGSPSRMQTGVGLQITKSQEAILSLQAASLGQSTGESCVGILGGGNKNIKKLDEERRGDWISGSL